MDIIQVLEILRPGEDWGSCAQSNSTYADFAANWRGISPVPTEEEMELKWAELELTKPQREATALRMKAVQALLSGPSPEQAATRAANAALWTHGRNNVAECMWAIVNLICERANVAVPTTEEIEAKITQLRLIDPGVSASNVADQGKRRLNYMEIVDILGATIISGDGDPVSVSP